ncbi:F-box/kelch-repeat protein At3g06240-like isoform X2 [Bidens hawaiensis]|uniref:F-box/kelch-repeat protein At3g06240-like isoform X2 n=1 Tax=Bidens hawaiensis TaxID=980011 RepID=UPI00404B7643
MDIAVEILLRLPVESVLRCKSISKSWYSLISDPQFVKSHLAISTTNNVHHRLIFSTANRKKLETCNLDDVLYDNSINAVELDHPSEHPSKDVWIVGSCNGLVFIAMYKALFIWNPSTRRSNRLPPSGCCKMQLGLYVVYGFGYQESTDDYKLVELYGEIKDRETLVSIYSLKSGKWKEIGVYPHVFSFFEFCKFSNGAIHWIAVKDIGPRIIVSLDLEKETYGEVLQPVYDEGDKDLRLGSLNEWLCVLCEYRGIRTDLWVMKVYGVKDSWTKLVSMQYLNVPRRDRLLRPLCMPNDGKFLLHFGWRKLIVYDSKNNSYSKIKNLDKCFGACTFVESLVSPMPPAAALGDI